MDFRGDCGADGEGPCFGGVPDSVLCVAGELADAEDAGAEAVGSCGGAQHFGDEFGLCVAHFAGCGDGGHGFGDGGVRVGGVEGDGY